jgi:mannose-1-phosphate guanylyltransferase
MRALLLAAGFGTRLRPLTDTVPKCLVPIGGKPLLEIWLERLSAAGVGPFLLNTHYLPEQVEAFVRASPYSRRVTLVNEPVLLGTAGTLLGNRSFFHSGEGLLIHADNFCLADLPAFVAAHHARPPQCAMTMMAFRTPTPASCGILEVDAQHVVTAFHEKVAAPPGNLANGAVYCLSSAILDEIAADCPWATDFSTEVLPRFMGRILAHETAEVFMDIGTPESYAAANRLADGAPARAS